MLSTQGHQPRYKAIKISCIRHPAVCKEHFVLLDFRGPGRDQVSGPGGPGCSPGLRLTLALCACIAPAVGDLGNPLNLPLLQVPRVQHQE